jgi:hypothetical protein
MLWKVTPKVPAPKVLWNPCTFADIAEVLQKISWRVIRTLRQRGYLSSRLYAGTNCETLSES